MTYSLIDLNDFLCLYFSLAQSAKPIAKKKQKSKPKAKHKKQVGNFAMHGAAKVMLIGPLGMRAVDHVILYE